MYITSHWHYFRTNDMPASTYNTGGNDPTASIEETSTTCCNATTPRKGSNLHILHQRTQKSNRKQRSRMSSSSCLIRGKVLERLDLRCEIVDLIRFRIFDSSKQRSALVIVDTPRNQSKILASAGKLKEFTLLCNAVFISSGYTSDEIQIEQNILKKGKE